jgi:hypothetical protein
MASKEELDSAISALDGQVRTSSASQYHFHKVHNNTTTTWKQLISPVEYHSVYQCMANIEAPN